jgi:hypothetical protein
VGRVCCDEKLELLLGFKLIKPCNVKILPAFTSSFLEIRSIYHPKSTPKKKPFFTPKKNKTSNWIK